VVFSLIFTGDVMKSVMKKEKEVEEVKKLLTSDFDEAPVDVELPKVEFKSVQELLDYCAELKKSASTPEEMLELEDFCQELIQAWMPKFAPSDEQKEEGQGGEE